MPIFSGALAQKEKHRTGRHNKSLTVTYLPRFGSRKESGRLKTGGGKYLQQGSRLVKM
jgi:hypothetical protein